LKYEAGGLYRLINEYGRVSDFAELVVFVAMHEPGSLKSDDVLFPMLWNFSVLKGDKIAYFNTSAWTLVPAGPET
jgi:hypothetical protein